jgi:hypothetical protein
MKAYLENLIPRLQKFSEKLDNTAVFTEHPWVLIDEETNTRQVLIFRNKDNELLVSQNGKVEKGKWEYLVHLKSLLIERNNEIFLFNQGFMDDSVMILKKDGLQEYQVLVNENKVKDFKIEKVLKDLEVRYIQKNIDVNETKKVFVDMKKETSRIKYDVNWLYLFILIMLICLILFFHTIK